MAQASFSAASAWSHTASAPTRNAGRSANFTRELREAEVAVDRGQQFDEPHRLGGDLLLGAEDVRIVLGERAHPHDAVQRAGRLVAVAGAELRQPQRQLAVGAQALAEDLDVARAVHRLQREHLVLVLDLAMNMCWRNFSQWPERSHSERSTSCGVFTSW